MDIQLSNTVSSLLMGVVEGFTEFLPVSSTGHLILTQQLLHFKADEHDFFDVFIQLGAILAVVVLYWRRFISCLDFSSYSSRSFNGLGALIKIGLACAPAFVCGALFHKTIKQLLFYPGPVAAALIVGGVIFLLVDTKNRRAVTYTLEEISYKQAFLIGVAQCFALWPGVSRSGSTIIGAMLCGVSRVAAAEFSFLVAVPVMLAATGYDFLKSMDGLSLDLLPVFAIGFATSFVTALLAIKFMMAILGKYTLAPFGIYRIALGLAVGALLFV